MIATRRAAVAALLLLGACAAAPERGYYRPEDAEPGPVIASHHVESEQAALDLRCQGVYENLVGGVPTVTVHVQAEITRPASGQLVVAREGWRVACEGPDGRLSLGVSEIWQGRERVVGDLTVPGFRRRAFDLFFDTTALVGRPPPPWLALSWRGGPGAAGLAGRCRFERIPPGSPYLPAPDPVADRDFGLRDGYYLPGAVTLGPRALQPSDEERAHYLHHAPDRFFPWIP